MVKFARVYDEHGRHRTHRNILYGIVVLLIIMQGVSFFVLTAQVSRLEIALADAERNLTKANEALESKIDSYNSLYQTEFQVISTSLTKQQEDFESQISLIKSSQEDFSGVIESVVKGVVGVATDKSVGTGFILSDEGYIVTNYHVVSEGNRINILTYEREVFEAEVIGADREKDVALLKIISGNYEELKLANSENVQVGNKVIAIGNPLGLSFTVTEGIVSAVNRAGPSGEREYIQTDVSLNPGNSGGPLINIKGEVIGINNFKVGGGAEGLGFALESNVIKESVNSFTQEEIA